MKTKIFEILKHLSLEQKRFLIIGLCAAVGLMLALFPSFATKDTQNAVFEKDTLYESDYVSHLEKRLSETISEIYGAGKAQVFITLESSYETVYLSNARLDESIDTVSQTRTTSEKQLATMKNGSSSEQPVVVKHLTPKISGVLIVCEGGENANVKNNIIKAASTALDVSSSRIYVTGGLISQ